jgi:signal transduction histidine kinase
VIRSLTRGQLAADIAAAGVLLLLVVWADLRTAPLTGPLVAVLLCASLAVRRLSPGLAIAGAWAGGLLQMATMQPILPADVALLGVLYASGAYGGRVSRWTGLASAGAGGAVAALYLVFLAPLAHLALPSDIAREVLLLAAAMIGTITLFGLSWTVGLLASTRRASREARVQAAMEAQRAAHEKAVEQERTRIARDMHDIVAHSLAVIIAQSDGARYAGVEHPELQQEALGTISTTAHAALAEVRALLTRLRHEEPDGPQPGFDDIPVLITGLRSAGLQVVERHTGSPAPLLTGTGLAAYRIVQESLTNALRHGDPAEPTTLEVHWEPGALRLTVRNSVTADAPPRVGAGHAGNGHAGHGVPGMRERAMLAGGTITAGLTGPNGTGSNGTALDGTALDGTGLGGTGPSSGEAATHTFEVVSVLPTATAASASLPSDTTAVTAQHPRVRSVQHTRGETP